MAKKRKAPSSSGPAVQKWVLILLLAAILVANMVRIGILIPVSPQLAATVMSATLAAGVAGAYTFKAWNKRLDPLDWPWALLLAICALNALPNELGFA